MSETNEPPADRRPGFETAPLPASGRRYSKSFRHRLFPGPSFWIVLLLGCLVGSESVNGQAESASDQAGPATGLAGPATGLAEPATGLAEPATGLAEPVDGRRSLKSFLRRLSPGSTFWTFWKVLLLGCTVGSFVAGGWLLKVCIESRLSIRRGKGMASPRTSRQRRFGRDRP